jgi:hypothetical protein
MAAVLCITANWMAEVCYGYQEHRFERTGLMWAVTPQATLSAARRNGRKVRQQGQSHRGKTIRYAITSLAVARIEGGIFSRSA